MKVLISGGAGFIGSHLARRAMDHGWDVVVVDNLSRGRRDNVPEDVPFYQFDLAASRLDDIFAEHRIDAVVHCAGQTSVPVSIKQPERDLQDNVIGTRRLLEACRAYAPVPFIFLSSGGAILGEVEGATEEAEARPISYYGIHKLMAEYYASISGLPFVNLRLSNVYGPGGRTDLEGGVISIFADRVKKWLPLQIHGDGSQVRDFIFVEDVVAAIMLFLGRNGELTGTWNVATGRATSLRDLVAALEQLVGRPLEVEYGPPRPGDIHTSILGIQKISCQLAWSPKYDLREGLALTLNSSA